MFYLAFIYLKVSSQQEGCSMFWSLGQFKRANEDDMRTYPLRSLLAEEEGTLSNVCADGYSRQSTQYYDAKTNVRDFELERWESINDVHLLFENHDEIRKIFR